MRTITPTSARLVPKDARRVFTGKIFDVYQWEQALYDGSTATFEMLKRPDTLQTFAIKDDRLIVCKEQQPSMGDAFYGLPGGRHDVASETELQAAQRELQEETGMKFKTWKLIAITQPYLKIEWFCYYFVATDFVSASPVQLDPGEKIEVQELDLATVMELARGKHARHLPLEFLSPLKRLRELTSLAPYEAK